MTMTDLMEGEALEDFQILEIAFDATDDYIQPIVCYNNSIVTISCHIVGKFCS